MPREVKKPTEQVYLANEFVENAHKKRAQNPSLLTKNPLQPQLNGKRWHSRQDCNHPSKDGENSIISKTGAHKTRPFTAQRAQKRAQFRVPETFDFVGNWESDDEAVERRVVEVN